MLSISVANQQERLELDYPRIKAVARAVLAGEGVTKGKVTIACMTDSAIHALNKRFLDHDEPTDVISFPYSTSKKDLQGELAISTEMALTVAMEQGHEPANELLLYVIHGLLHLCGFDDLEDDDRKKMRQRERHYLQQEQIKIKPEE
jgi:probable rRNA maturation factor